MASELAPGRQYARERWNLQLEVDDFFFISDRVVGVEKRRPFPPRDSTRGFTPRQFIIYNNYIGFLLLVVCFFRGGLNHNN